MVAAESGAGASPAEHTRGALEQLARPLRNLVRMHLEVLGELGEGLITADRRQAPFSLERC
jgi:hypothetical protein